MSGGHYKRLPRSRKVNGHNQAPRGIDGSKKHVCPQEREGTTSVSILGQFRLQSNDLSDFAQ